jgi:hypothetical protein
MKKQFSSQFSIVLTEDKVYICTEPLFFSKGCDRNGYPCECEHANDDVDLPLSKRICRLHLEHANEAEQSRISPNLQHQAEQVSKL